MPKYIIQKHLPGNDYGEWSNGEEFSAANDEAAKQVATEIIGMQGLLYGNSRIRIQKVIFDGLPEETGYPLPRNEME